MIDDIDYRSMLVLYLNTLADAGVLTENAAKELMRLADAYAKQEYD